MQVRAFVTDLDKTIVADQAPLNDPAVMSLFSELRRRGVICGLNTGRALDHAVGTGGVSDPLVLSAIDFVITEGGGARLDLRSRQLRRFGPRHSRGVVSEMRRLGVPSTAIWPGECAISSCYQYNDRIQVAIARVNRRRQRLGARPLDLEGTRNGQWVVYLPRGVNKGSSMLAELQDRGLHSANTVGAGDGENDIPFLSRCGLALVPSDAHPSVLALPNAIVADEPGPAGVAKLLRRLLDGQIPGWTVSPPQAPGRAVA